MLEFLLSWLHICGLPISSDRGGIFDRRSAAGGNPGEDELHRIPGQMFFNGASDVACLFTQQGQNGTNQDAMIVWECCLVDRLGSDIGIYNWWVSYCPWHISKLGGGSTIGAGVYVLVGIVAREPSGPALSISFLIAGIAAALSTFCYVELASRCPSIGSAYHYSYIGVGEGVAWLIGWALILEYTIGGSAIAHGISPNLVLCVHRDLSPDDEQLISVAAECMCITSGTEMNLMV